VNDWKLDLSLNGYRKVFKEYHKATIDFLLEDPESSYGSGKVWNAINDRGVKISRASVIFYLDFLVEKGICVYEVTTGKGGHFRLYKIAGTWEFIKNMIMIDLLEGIGEALDTDMTWALER